MTARVSVARANQNRFSYCALRPAQYMHSITVLVGPGPSCAARSAGNGATKPAMTLALASSPARHLYEELADDLARLIDKGALRRETGCRRCAA